MTNDEIKRELLESYGLTEEEFDAIDVLLGGTASERSPYFSDAMIPTRVAEATELLDTTSRRELGGDALPG